MTFDLKGRLGWVASCRAVDGRPARARSGLPPPDFRTNVDSSSGLPRYRASAALYACTPGDPAPRCLAAGRCPVPRALRRRNHCCRRTWRIDGLFIHVTTSTIKVACD
ncbi:unnamed protein product [Euphydryas editha]|uniref:Uncharacterized protein n=1 Tax=Euphydryas editha TaxID=104508 RepID=A0AAU9V393_EUPED|nr:unnamed protein product [Euphydryas editha]